MIRPVGGYRSKRCACICFFHLVHSCLVALERGTSRSGKAVDLTREGFSEEKFDIALDKACFDTIMCNPNGVTRANNYLQQMDRWVPMNAQFVLALVA